MLERYWHTRVAAKRAAIEALQIDNSSLGCYEIRYNRLPDDDGPPINNPLNT